MTSTKKQSSNERSRVNTAVLWLRQAYDSGGVGVQTYLISNLLPKLKNLARQNTRKLTNLQNPGGTIAPLSTPCYATAGKGLF